MEITGIRLRGILDSRGQPTIEADVWLGRFSGRGSCPVAIAPGRLERQRRVYCGGLGVLEHTAARRLLDASLTGTTPAGQAEIDARLRELDDRHGLGADVTLAVSLAYARAAAATSGRALHEWLTDLADAAPAWPRLLVNMFSGGIHEGAEPDSFQQIMVIPHEAGLVSDVHTALAIYADLERTIADQYGEPTVSASSGFLIPDSDIERKLDMVTRACEKNSSGRVTVGLDIAAEHLAAENGFYRYQGRKYASADFRHVLLGLARTYAIEYIEDPFDPGDVDGWREFLPAARDMGMTVVGDDLFVTEPARVRPGLADAVLLKPSQAGTVTTTLEAARAARDNGMRLVVSHRSGETEDTAMCDLGVAVGAEWIKVGGPRRGDRTAKYNQLIRLTECDLRLPKEI
jgi:enolase